jgi:hypothetical protein
MKYGSIHFSTARVSICEIAGAVALCALRDLSVNLFRFGGFPQVLVQEAGDNFEVTISVIDEQKIEDSFTLTRTEAFNAAKAFKKGTTAHDPHIFERVQIALARVVG